MAEQSPPTWRYCGSQVKLWRYRAGVSREKLAQEANYAVETVRAMEQGRRRPTPRLLQVADDLCGAGGLLVAALTYLKPERYVPQVGEFMDAESQAIALSSYQTLYIPGLLQTEAYMRALMTKAWPPMEDELLEERVTARLLRQKQRADKAATPFNFVLYEAALRTCAGGPEVMRGQLQRLLDAGSLRNVSVQVLPFAAGAHSGLSGPFVLVETPDHEHYGYVEGQGTYVLHSDGPTVSSMEQLWGHLRMHALNIEDSAQLIRKVMREL